jgi:hypothetical protein
MTSNKKGVRRERTPASSNQSIKQHHRYAKNRYDNREYDG